jgi:hypothetical protein
MNPNMEECVIYVERRNPNRQVRELLPTDTRQNETMITYRLQYWDLYVIAFFQKFLSPPRLFSGNLSIVKIAAERWKRL